MPQTNPTRRGITCRDYLRKADIESSCNCAGVLLMRPRLNGSPEILLVESHRKSYQFSFPKGKRNRGEDTLSAALRELHEETGIRPQDVQLFPGRWYIEYRLDTGMPHIIYYLGYVIDPNVQLNPIDKKEIVAAAWYAPEDIYEMKRTFYLSRRQIIRKAVSDFWLREKMMRQDTRRESFLNPRPVATVAA